jgi:hypothetical protein
MKITNVITRPWEVPFLTWPKYWLLEEAPRERDCEEVERKFNERNKFLRRRGF